MNLLYIAGIDQSITMLIILGVLMVLMVVMSIIPQKKRQKQAQEMMNNLKVGTKIKTIGGFVGDIVSIDAATNLMVLDLSPNGDRSALCTIDRSAVYSILNVNKDGTITDQTNEKAKALDDAPVEEVKSDDKKTEI